MSYPQVEAAIRPIPKGLHPPAQGCEERATLGTGSKSVSTPTGLQQPTSWEIQPRWGCGLLCAVPQGSSFLATLGFVTESLWDSAKRPSESWAMRSPRGEITSAVFWQNWRVCRSASSIKESKPGDDGGEVNGLKGRTTVSPSPGGEGRGGDGPSDTFAVLKRAIPGRERLIPQIQRAVSAARRRG